MRAVAHHREANAERREASAGGRHQTADLGPVHRHLDRLHTATSPLRGLERQRIAARVEAQCLAEGAESLDERGLDAIGCRRRTKGAAIALDAALRTEGPTDTQRNRIV